MCASVIIPGKKSLYSFYVRKQFSIKHKTGKNVLALSRTERHQIYECQMIVILLTVKLLSVVFMHNS